jgi:hypothetical protein
MIKNLRWADDPLDQDGGEKRSASRRKRDRQREQARS